MGKFSREKGKRGEREWAEFLRDRGFVSRRGVQFHGGLDSPDVITRDLGRVHWEVKRVEGLSLYMALDQARGDAGDKIPVIAHRRNGKPWVVILDADLFITTFLPYLRDLNGQEATS